MVLLLLFLLLSPTRLKPGIRCFFFLFIVYKQTKGDVVFLRNDRSFTFSRNLNSKKERKIRSRQIHTNVVVRYIHISMCEFLTVLKQNFAEFNNYNLTK